jgi:radical SAM superfamily enzyme YgiQ (UPF0313 family)
MKYEEPVYRPPSEAGSLLIQATIGCPHNRCTFCNMYKTKKFRIRPLGELIGELQEARKMYGDLIRTIFFPDGNTVCMKTDDLAALCEAARKTFPKLERITVYGSSRFINRKTPEEWQRLAAAGLNRVHSGLESGDDMVLEYIKKGSTAAESIAAGRKVKDAGIDLSEYVLIGIGGRKYWQQHAVNTARVLNEINPDFIRIRTYTPVPETLLFEEYSAGKFILPSPLEALQEVRLLVEELTCNSMVLSDHISNYWDVQGRPASDKDTMLAGLDYALSLPEDYFHVNDPRFL